MKERFEILNEIQLSGFIYRKFLSTNEIKLCNQLTKENILEKGYPDEGNATIAFFLTNKGEKLLNEYGHKEF